MAGMRNCRTPSGVIVQAWGNEPHSNACFSEPQRLRYARELRGWGGLIWPKRFIPVWRRRGKAQPWRKTEAVADLHGQTERVHPQRRESRVSSLPLLTDAGCHRGSPTQDEEVPLKPADDIRILLYGEVLQAWRLLTDVRFRLMNLLPAISIVAFVPLLALTASSNNPALIGGILLAMLGLCLSHGLHIYDHRNDAIYNHTLSRARRIEAELDIDTGLMLGRPKHPHARVSHGRATAWVFRSVKAAWLVVAAVMFWAVIDNQFEGDSSTSITVEVLSEIGIGSNRDDVQDLAGGDGELRSLSSSSGTVIVERQYHLDDDSIAVITFEDEAVASIAVLPDDDGS